MRSYSGTCEIVEARKEPRSVRGSERAHESRLGPSLDGGVRKPPMQKLGCKDSLEDDLDQLFGAISLRHPKNLGLQCQAGTNASLLRESAMKRPITVGVPRSPGIGNSESLSLKQALRELCISKASDMAATKRLSQSINSPRISEAGRIKSLYKLVVVETTRSAQPSGDGKGTVVETSLGPEVSKSNSSDKIPQQQQMSRIKSSSKSAHSTPRFLGSKAPNQSILSSPRIGVPATEYTTRTTIMSNEIVSSSRRVGTQDLKVPNQSAVSSPTFVDPKTQTYMEVTLTRNETDSASRRVANQASKLAYESTHSFSRHAVPTAQNGSGSAPMQNDIGYTSRKVGGQASKMEILLKEKRTSATSLTCSNSIVNAQNLDIDIPTMLIAKTACKAPARSGWKVRLHVAPASSTNRHRVSKFTRNTSRIRPVMRNKTIVKKKVKPGTVATASNSNEGNRSLVHGTSQLVCHKCQCSLIKAAEDSNQVFLDSFSASPSADVSIGSMNSGASKTEFTSSNCNPSRALGKAKNLKSREEGGFSQTSKSSDYSTSTSNSYESNASMLSCGNRPHMSKDLRWQAINCVKMQDGLLSLKHFNLLKKLGGGDIGTVYLAELIGSKCLFAIKVMDNEFLARRKKMARAQTEREILRMLDHPFLPTLYAQFRSDHLSCLVMEYCPGGDLHVLRQKQLGRCFPEQAARFYVAEVLLALEYLHMLGVIYRDLKPENVLVREDGHVMLTDFDLSLRCSVSPTLLKSPSTDPVHVRVSAPCTERSCIEPLCTGPSCQVPCFSPRFLAAAAKARKLKAAAAAQVRSLPQLVAEPTDARSNSFVGTHEYLAPEIIKGEGHGAAVDWWTFGVFLYELLYGITPFKGPGNEETLANVVSRSLKFPDSPVVSFQARDLIRGLLAKEPEYRVGSKKGAAEIKQHPFFEGLNWALIRCTIPPELPEFNNFEEKSSSKYLGFQATAEHLEFDLF